MILGSISSCSISRNASFTSGRNTSPMVISASGRTPTSGASGSGRAVTSANATPRSPLALADSYADSSSSACPMEISASGAPSTNVLRSGPADSCTALQRRAELNGTCASGTPPFFPPAKRSASADAVLLSSAVAAAKAPSHPSTPETPDAHVTPCTVSRFAVSVPVLSRHTTSA